MVSQKVCIIGGSLTGLVTAIALSKLNCDIDLITDNTYKNTKNNRTIAISENNLNFLKKLNICKNLNNEVWPCSVMKLYSGSKIQKFSEIFDLDKGKEHKKIFHMIKNEKLSKMMFNKVKKISTISLKNFGKISEINNEGLLKSIKFNNIYFKYNLIIICTGYNSSLVKKLFNNQELESSYKETSLTSIFKHNVTKNNIARQIFFDNEILALLPISKKETSVVLSLKESSVKKLSELMIKNKIKTYAKNFYKKINFKNKIEYNKPNFLIRNQYFKERILLFGDALHTIHPFVGQGFNMILRDLASLESILTKKIDLGLDIGGSDILQEFSNTIKPKNFIFSIGTDLLKNSLSHKKIRDSMLTVANKSKIAKSIFFDIADSGLKF
tara:strand:+ start:42 stop:1193 length:1152 start_codon:yes stop_codon:yes gene_type:complete